LKTQKNEVLDREKQRKSSGRHSQLVGPGLCRAMVSEKMRAAVSLACRELAYIRTAILGPNGQRRAVILSGLLKTPWP
jgi:hypothetical protein